MVAKTFQSEQDAAVKAMPIDTSEVCVNRVEEVYAMLVQIMEPSKVYRLQDLAVALKRQNRGIRASIVSSVLYELRQRGADIKRVGRGAYVYTGKPGVLAEAVTEGERLLLSLALLNALTLESLGDEDAETREVRRGIDGLAEIAGRWFGLSDVKMSKYRDIVTSAELLPPNGAPMFSTGTPLSGKMLESAETLFQKLFEDGQIDAEDRSVTIAFEYLRDFRSCCD